MDFNKFIFPAPKSSYTASSLQKILWIPRSRFFSMKTFIKSMDKFENYYADLKTVNKTPLPDQQSQLCIPCHYQNFGESHKNLILYFHGNAEDIGYASGFARKIAFDLRADILSVEYPGYGIYEGDSNAQTILEDAEIVFDFLTAEVGILPENIIVFGRSIGSGPATHLAAHRKPGALILMSPYTSIKSVVRDMAGPIASALVAERFSNIEEIEKVECPSIFIHGKKDKVIPWEHSKALFLKCKAVTALHLSETMCHNGFMIESDILQPIKKFLKQSELKGYKGRVVFPGYILKAPVKEIKGKGESLAARLVENLVKDF